MPPIVNVICARWGTKFGPMYVNRLGSMVRRHLRRPHRFICFTHDGRGLDPGIEVRPLPELRLPEGLPERGWRKLVTFRTSETGLSGTTLFLDLDVVVVDDLEPFFTYPGRFLIIRDYKFLRRERWVGNSSVYRFEPEEWADIPDDFERNQESIRERVRNEQEYLSRFVHERGALRHWPSAWCPSFKRDCMWKGPLGLFLRPRLPEGARIVVFHGHPNPEEAMEGRSGSWKRVMRPTPWIRDHWR